MMKLCIKCKNEKSTADFYKCSKSLDGLNSYCKTCNKLEVKKYTYRCKELNKNIVGEVTKEKKCSICKRIKTTIDFNKDKYKHDGLSNKCKVCTNDLNKKYTGLVDIDIKKQYNKNYYIKNSDKIKTNVKLYRIQNKKIINNKRIMRDKQPLRRIINRLRKRIVEALFAQGKPKYTKTQTMIGCSFLEFQKYIESKFTKGMSFENYGKWHLDHIKPCASFDLSKENEVLICFHYTNIQPLWAIDNIKKSSIYNNKKYYIR